MYCFMITFAANDLQEAEEQFGMDSRELMDFLNNLQTESDSPRGKKVRQWILNRMLSD